MKVIVVDDEPETLEEMRILISEIPGFEVVGVYNKPAQALSEYAIKKPDCAFLDIEMPVMTGVDLAEKLLEKNPQMEIVFVTAFNHYATQAFEVNALDYVLKPIHPKRFFKTVEKLMQRGKLVSSSNDANLSVQTFGRFEVFVNQEPIKWNRSKARELFAYLLHFEGQKRSKYKICDDIWPEFDAKQALANLQTTLCALRKNIGLMGREGIRIEFLDESYLLKRGNVAWDKAAFEMNFDELMKNHDYKKGEKAVSLYIANYLSQEDWTWSQIERESMSLKYNRLVRKLSEHYYENKKYGETFELLKKLYERYLMENHLQIMFLESTFKLWGIAELKEQFNVMRKFYRKEYGADLCKEVISFCKKMEY